MRVSWEKQKNVDNLRIPRAALAADVAALTALFAILLEEGVAVLALVLDADARSALDAFRDAVGFVCVNEAGS